MTTPAAVNLQQIKQYGDLYYLDLQTHVDGQEPVETYAIVEYKQFDNYGEGHDQQEEQYFWSLHYFGWNKPSQLN